MGTVEVRVSKSIWIGAKGGKKGAEKVRKSSASYLGPGCREFESRHSDQKRLILEQNQSLLTLFDIPVEETRFQSSCNIIFQGRQAFVSAAAVFLCLLHINLRFMILHRYVVINCWCAFARLISGQLPQQSLLPQFLYCLCQNLHESFLLHIQRKRQLP